MSKTVLASLLAPLRWLLRALMAALILFEEWGWAPLHRAMQGLARLPLLRQLATWLAGLPPYAALAVLLLPSLLIIPVKLLAVWLIVRGRALLGLAVIITAKVLGTALLAWLFQLCQPALMRLDWFARLYARWSRWKTELLDWVHGSTVWRQMQGWRRQLRVLGRRWWRRQRPAGCR